MYLNWNWIIFICFIGIVICEKMSILKSIEYALFLLFCLACKFIILSFDKMIYDCMTRLTTNPANYANYTNSLNLLNSMNLLNLTNGNT